MGVRLWRSFFVLLWVYFFVIGPARADPICDVSGCACTKKTTWTVVNCTLKNDQELKLDSHYIGNGMAEIFIVGGKEILIGRKSFNHLPALSMLSIKGARNLVMEKESFRNLTNPSLVIQIHNCDQFILKTGAFVNVVSAIEVEIVRCASVDVEKSAFNKLHTAHFEHIPKLNLASGAFEIRNEGIISKHGPFTVVSFNYVTIPTIPPQTFFSTLAELRFENSYLQDIQNEAVSANQITAVYFINSQIDYLHGGAFVHKTLIPNFRLSNCTIYRIDTGAVNSGIGNLTIEHSRITEIRTGAVNTTVVNVEFVGNEIANFHSMGFVFHDCNKINVEQNLIKHLHSNFLVAPESPNVVRFSYINNDVFHVEPGALSFVPHLEDRAFTFKSNFFNQTCHCAMDEWFIELTTANVTSKSKEMMNNTFCTVNDLLSQCFQLPIGVINLQNFTELVCNTNNTIICEPYRGETKIVNTTSKIFADNEPPAKTSWLTLIISLTSVLLLIVLATFVIMLIRGSRWLKRKGYFRKFQYNHNEHSNDEENTIETVDESDKLDISEDLTIELLQELSKKLDDPETNQEASELIEQLYQKYIRENGTENNNQQEEEAHLYEELGNLQLEGARQDADRQQNGARDILRLMEEKFNTQFEPIDADEARPALAGEYSEPSDAAVHLYSELKQNKDSESENRDSLGSRSSGSMAFRPLPDKPGPSKL